MRKIRELLRLKYELGRSARHRQQHGERLRAAGISWPLPEELDDTALERALFPSPPPSRVRRPEPDWGHVRRELQRHKVVTLQLLWLEYREVHPNGYQSTWPGGRLPPRARDRHGELPVRQLHPRHRPRPGRSPRATRPLPARRARLHPRARILHHPQQRKGVIAALSVDDRLSLLLEREKTEREQRRCVSRASPSSTSTPPSKTSTSRPLRTGRIPHPAPRLRTVDPGRPDRPRQRRHRVGEELSRLCPRPPGLPPRHLDPLLRRLASARRTHPRPGATGRIPSSSSGSPGLGSSSSTTGGSLRYRARVDTTSSRFSTTATPAVARCSPARSRSTSSTGSLITLIVSPSGVAR